VNSGPSRLPPTLLVESPTLHPSLLPSFSDSNGANILQIPSSSRHQRSSSGSSNASDGSGWSDWLPSPIDQTTSEFGDPHIETRPLSKSTESKIGEPKEPEDTDSPFAFTKTQLGRGLYDPKNLEALNAIDGLAGLVMGLRTDVRKGLSPDEDILDGRVTAEDVWRTFENGQSVSSPIDGPSSPERGKAHGTVLNPTSETGPPANTTPLARSKNELSTFRDRKRIYGENKIPVRPLKNIFQLMWITLHDKTLVRKVYIRHSP